MPIIASSHMGMFEEAGMLTFVTLVALEPFRIHINSTFINRASANRIVEYNVFPIENGDGSKDLSILMGKSVKDDIFLIKDGLCILLADVPVANERFNFETATLAAVAILINVHSATAYRAAAFQVFSHCVSSDETMDLATREVHR